MPTKEHAGDELAVTKALYKAAFELRGAYVPDVDDPPDPPNDGVAVSMEPKRLSADEFKRPQENVLMGGGKLTPGGRSRHHNCRVRSEEGVATSSAHLLPCVPPFRYHTKKTANALHHANNKSHTSLNATKTKQVNTAELISSIIVRLLPISTMNLYVVTNGWQRPRAAATSERISSCVEERDTRRSSGVYWRRWKTGSTATFRDLQRSLAGCKLVLQVVRIQR